MALILGTFYCYGKIEGYPLWNQTVNIGNCETSFLHEEGNHTVLLPICVKVEKLTKTILWRREHDYYSIGYVMLQKSYSGQKFFAIGTKVMLCGLFVWKSSKDQFGKVFQKWTWFCGLIHIIKSNRNVHPNVKYKQLTNIYILPNFLEQPS